MGRASPASKRTIQFGVFEVDLRAGELRRRGVKVKLQDQPLQILQILLENPGERAAIEVHARNKVERVYGWDAIAREQKKLYESLLELPREDRVI